MAHCVHCGSHAIAGLGDANVLAQVKRNKQLIAEAAAARKAAEEAGYTVPGPGGGGGGGGGTAGSSNTLMYVGVAGLLAAGVFFAMKDKKGG